MLPMHSAFLIFASFAAGGLVNAASTEQVGFHTPGKQMKPSWGYTNCGEPTDIIQLRSLKVTPDPPQPGKNLTITVEGEARETIEEGAYADVVVKVGRIKILQREFDICEEALKANASVTCPVEKGEYTVTQTVELPREIPPAPFTVELRGNTVDDDPLVCLDIFADFRK
ncbi:ML domain-containing protein [Favolaschia claudopus]|uniref:Phosphatidylglycerol/phosphatidylinositol transfer protein n=1 Tax=Favolaschia claudopus TaxID=2862362 RepID=A0AAV9Z2K2_9AGAR